MKHDLLQFSIYIFTMELVKNYLIAAKQLILAI